MTSFLGLKSGLAQVFVFLAFVAIGAGGVAMMAAGKERERGVEASGLYVEHAGLCDLVAQDAILNVEVGVGHGARRLISGVELDLVEFDATVIGAIKGAFPVGQKLKLLSQTFSGSFAGRSALVFVRRFGADLVVVNQGLFLRSVSGKYSNFAGYVDIASNPLLAALSTTDCSQLPQTVSAPKDRDIGPFLPLPSPELVDAGSRSFAGDRVDGGVVP